MPTPAVRGELRRLNRTSLLRWFTSYRVCNNLCEGIMGETSGSQISRAYEACDGTVEFFAVTTVPSRDFFLSVTSHVALMGRVIFDPRAETITVVAPRGARATACLYRVEPLVLAKTLLREMYRQGKTCKGE